jgi:hypothetical protein
MRCGVATSSDDCCWVIISPNSAHLVRRAMRIIQMLTNPVKFSLRRFRSYTSSYRYESCIQRSRSRSRSPLPRNRAWEYHTNS